jgi:hypothetical protein
MATHDYNIANQGFPAFRTDLNDALAAIVSNNSNATAPATTFAHMIWVDTAANPSVLKIRNADNDAWITIGSLNQTDDKFKLTPADGVSTDTISELTSAAGVTIDGVLLKDNGVVTGAGTVSAPVYSTTGDTNTGIFFPAADTIAFAEGGVEAGRFDSSGNLLVGKTSQNSALAGCELLPNGTAQFTRDGNDALRLNRLTSDGDILEFNKDGTTAGVIGVVDGNDIYITSDNVALRLGLGSSAGGIYPANSNGTVRDNATNLGGASERFKDLYLSGSVYLGGTTSANALDDYEEGTFTPTAVGGTTAGTTTYTTQQGSYIKIGSQVTISVRLAYSALTGTGELRFGNFPFASRNDSMEHNGAIMTNNLNWSGGTSIVLYVLPGTTQGVIFGSADDAGWSAQQCVNESVNAVFTVTYFTS